MNKNRQSLTGFTLIEVLVVVSIIGILSALIYVNFTEARNSSKNRAWQTELKEVQLALEVYKSQNGYYPSAQKDFYAQAACKATSGLSAESDDCPVFPIIEDFIPNYISELPKDQDTSIGGCNMVYKVDSATDASWYKFSAENCLVGVDSTSGTQAEDGFALCPESCSTCGGSAIDPTSADFYESLAVYSPGGRCE